MARAILRPIEPGHRRVLALAWPALIGNRWLLLRILALSMGASLMVLIQPYLSKVLIDQGAMAGNLRVLVASCALMLGGWFSAALGRKHAASLAMWRGEQESREGRREQAGRKLVKRMADRDCVRAFF